MCSKHSGQLGGHSCGTHTPAPSAPWSGKKHEKDNGHAVQTLDTTHMWCAFDCDTQRRHVHPTDPSPPPPLHPHLHLHPPRNMPARRRALYTTPPRFPASAATPQQCKPISQKHNSSGAAAAACLKAVRNCDVAQRRFHSLAPSPPFANDKCSLLHQLARRGSTLPPICNHRICARN
jgi:hypothetical protein